MGGKVGGKNNGLILSLKLNVLIYSILANRTRKESG